MRRERNLPHAARSWPASASSLQVDLLNSDIVPRVPRWGSVGGSGDLVPSCYIARALVGKGRVAFRGASDVPASQALEEAGVPPLVLQAKEGLGERATLRLQLHVCRELCAPDEMHRSLSPLCGLGPLVMSALQRCSTAPPS